MDRTNSAAVSALSEEECWSLLARCELGRLALAVQDEPDIFPVNYCGRWPSRAVPHSARVQARRALSVNPRVAFEVDEFDDTHAASVVLKGVAKRLELQREIDAADALPLTPWIPTLKYRWVRITPTSIAGRSFERAPEPDRYMASTIDAWT